MCAHINENRKTYLESPRFGITMADPYIVNNIANRPFHNVSITNLLT